MSRPEQTTPWRGWACPSCCAGRAAGGCYLGDPRLGVEFTDGDLALLHLAAQGVATIIEKARTAAANRQREAWYENGVRAAREIVAGAPDPLRLVVERAAAVSGSSVACVVQRGTDADHLLVTAATGTAAEEMAGDGAAGARCRRQVGAGHGPSDDRERLRETSDAGPVGAAARRRHARSCSR